MADTLLAIPPTSGFTTLPWVLAPPSSMVSGQNIWVVDNELRPRDRLESFATVAYASSRSIPNMTNGNLLVHYDSRGTAHVVAISANSMARLTSSLEWSFSSYRSSHGSNYFSSQVSDTVFGTTVYLPRIDQNVLMWSNNSDPVFVGRLNYADIGAGGESELHSTGTQVPICRDICAFDDRWVAWNIRELSGTTRYVQRVKWAVAGDPEDATGIGSGAEDLLDMHGAGTRIVPTTEQLVLGSDAEIWRGRKVGLPFVFDFSPMHRQVGMPFPKAVCETPWGIVFLDYGWQVNLLQGETIIPIGDGIQDVLSETALNVNLNTAFFGFHAQRQTITLYYSTDQSGDAADPQNAFTFHMRGAVWTPQRFNWQLRSALGLKHRMNIPSGVIISP